MILHTTSAAPRLRPMRDVARVPVALACLFHIPRGSDPRMPEVVLEVVLEVVSEVVLEVIFFIFHEEAIQECLK